MDKTVKVSKRGFSEITKFSRLSFVNEENPKFVAKKPGIEKSP